ncbi:MAG: hypothetical protein FFODKBPE_00570 [Candidatus Argoarchaeum ethanivorans]|uniref:MobA-like NTP transferase domain-containing protein n=1 Tax=Candidatus Argoarchaeum ethanivorans TaxID=2608793 RepID=A0A811TH11_9EURY|nr:MAG: hypothetical protein FFODKBPE_00570 [Candidatus Argoarchaeum ethanivorans]
MQAVILAAGEKQRLEHFTATKPKVMINVANGLIIEYVVNTLKRIGCAIDKPKNIAKSVTVE